MDTKKDFGREPTPRNQKILLNVTTFTTVMTGAMKKLRLGCDLDGVVYRWSDTARYILQAYRNESPGESLDYDWIKNHITPESWQWLWTDGVAKHGLFRYGSIYKGMRKFLEDVEPLYENVVITSRPDSARQDTIDWLAFQKLPTSEVHIVGPGQPKSEIEPQCDVYIDDAIHNCQDLMINTKGLVVMPDRPWNQGYYGDDYTRFHRTYSVAHMKFVLEQYHAQVNGNG